MDASRGLGLSLIIPAFNEQESIAQAIGEAEEALRAQFSQFEILVVDDGSSDRTVPEVVRLLPKAPHTRLLRHEVNCGYGAALRTGFTAARYDWVAFTDADCQFDLRELSRLVVLAQEVPIVVGYRVRRQDPWRRRFLSWGYNVLARLLLGTRVRDVDCALKVFRRDIVTLLMPQSRGFFVNSEMLTRARLRGLEVAEVPVTHRPRLGGASKVSLWEIPRICRTLLTFWWREIVRGQRALIIPEASSTLPTIPPADVAPKPVLGPSSSLVRPIARPGHGREAA
ncbi:MAG: glycosyltransferase family 2 protein [Gemmataceae bacterium]|nr:glycosyltransferase family 2 protein [Gemmata sp.]MDW8197530.1 glycosyltransferase family 2 protein [Gemmataceae bacterium]